MSLMDQDYRFYCDDMCCRWLNPNEQKEFHPDMIDCTDLSDDEFENFVLKDLKEITKP